MKAYFSKKCGKCQTVFYYRQTQKIFTALNKKKIFSSEEKGVSITSKI